MAPEPLFLARDSYRRRRLADAARLLPWLGGFAFLVPMLWAAQAGTAAGVVYLFGVWAGLIGACFLLSRWLRDDVDPRDPEGRDG